MGKLYKVGEYGEMKLGEFRKNIMQYTRNNLRSIISSSDPEIVEIAIDELTRRGEELKDGGRTGYAGGGGISQLDIGAPNITYSGNEGPKSPQQIKQMQMTMADPLLEDEYEKYVFEMEEQGLQPMSFEEFEREARSGMAEGGVAMQGGVENYFPSEMVTVPKKAKSSKNHPATELAYITKAEKDLLIKKDLHNSLNGKPNKGPGGIISLNGDFGIGESYGDRQTSDTSPEAGDRGGGYQERGDPGYQDTIDRIRKAAREEEARQQARTDSKKKK